MEAPASSSICTQARVPDSAAMCSAVIPFSARVSMYLTPAAEALI